jgi:pimeloyl-ACP methyl ester carboxylesterase
LLEVPLDYTDTSAGTTNLGIIKQLGETADAQEVLVNPGGPGASSVDFVIWDFERIRSKIGTKYALVGIDPRGTKYSGPNGDCFADTSKVASNAFTSNVFTPPDIAHEYELKINHQSFLEYGKWCSQAYSVNDTARYAGTVATAQDMLHYIQLRAKDTGRSPETAKLWYYGISYGTALGGTFAALYPDRVERMILDGVLSLENEFTADWEGSLADGDKAARFWFQRCFEAGPELCAFSQNATSWQQLEQRYLSMLDHLKGNPIGLGDPLSEAVLETAESGVIINPHVFTWQNLVTFVFTSSYLLSPILFTALDIILTELRTGNYSLIQTASVQAQLATIGIPQDERVSRALITCLDGNRRTNLTDFDDFKDYVHRFYDASNYSGLNVASTTGPVCSQMDITAPESQIFDGELTLHFHLRLCPCLPVVGVPKLNGKQVPILYVNGIADPITPLANAREEHENFPGSGLLVFNNSGVSGDAAYTVSDKH